MEEGRKKIYLRLLILKGKKSIRLDLKFSYETKEKHFNVYGNMSCCLTCIDNMKKCASYVALRLKKHKLICTEKNIFGNKKKWFRIMCPPFLENSHITDTFITAWM